MANNDIVLSHEDLENLIEASVKHALANAESDSKPAICARAKAFAQDTLTDNAKEGIFDCYKDVVIDRCKQATLVIVGSLCDFVLKNLVVIACIAVAIILVYLAVFISSKAIKH
jgi:hypothetical protein